MAVTSAVARPTHRLWQRPVANLTGVMVGATMQVTVNDQRAPDSGPHRGVDNIPQPASGTEVMLTKCEHIRVVVHHDRQMQRVLESVAYRHARPAGQQGVR